MSTQPAARLAALRASSFSLRSFPPGSSSFRSSGRSAPRLGRVPHAAAIVALLAGSAAMAQSDERASTASDNAATLPPVSVKADRGAPLVLSKPAASGSRLGLTPLETPASIEVLEGEKIRERGDLSVVDAVSLGVRRGEVYGFLGPNGAGKTTTLRMVLGLIRPSAGTARVLGVTAGRAGAVRRVGALIEGPGFYPYLSGRENLRVLARYQGLPDAAADRSLAQVDLTDRAGHRFRSYSLGMKQRLGVAAALLGDPELVVLDEPTNGLDPAGMQEMRGLVVALARGGRTVLLSSHLLTEVQDVCDRVGVIHDGRLLRESTVAELRGATSLRVRATPVEQALAVARRVTGEGGARRSEGTPGDALVVDLPASAAPALTRALVADGVQVYEIALQERSLEEVFFEMTTGRTSPARPPVVAAIEDEEGGR